MKDDINVTPRNNQKARINHEMVNLVGASVQDTNEPRRVR